ncbi:unnamed protein product [Cuscuta campestris]|uniref:Reverse transcriptase domain-containing protein n=1 Tax=Cuscuta campestris TaxID=132261 RepID=A0A484KMJ2_9ASTE|nr:unnamed protein product [Cuscuta campestris]
MVNTVVKTEGVFGTVCKPSKPTTNGLLEGISISLLNGVNTKVVNEYKKSTHPYGGMAGLSSKLRCLKGVLTVWNKSTFGNIFSNLKEAEEQAISAQEAYEQDPNHSNREADNKARAHLIQATNIELLFWKQKANLKWISEGDCNSKFYHAYVKGRRAKAKIRCIYDQTGKEHRDMENISRRAIDHFTNVLSNTQSIQVEPMMDYLEEVITAEDNERICKLTFEEEIRAAVWSLDLGSAPGPDGFNGTFYRTCWNIIKTDVISATQEFFTGVPIPKVYGSTFITLIPKNEKPRVFGDFRPIFLSTFMSKINTRILANRIQAILPKIISDEQTGFQKGMGVEEQILLVEEMVHKIDSKGNTSGNNKYHWTKWEDVCKPKEEGGLGVRDIRDIQDAYSIKMWWNFRYHNNKWAQFMRQKERWGGARAPVHNRRLGHAATASVLVDYRRLGHGKEGNATGEGRYHWRTATTRNQSTCDMHIGRKRTVNKSIIDAPFRIQAKRFEFQFSAFNNLIQITERGRWKSSRFWINLNMVQWLSSCFEYILLNPATTYWDQDLTAGNRALRFTLDTNASGFFIRIVEKFENGHSIIFVPEDCCRHGFRLFLAFLNKASYLLLNNKGNLKFATQKVGDATTDHLQAVPNEQTLMSGNPKLNVEARNSKVGPRALTNLEKNDTILQSQKATLEKSHVGDMGSNKGGSSGSFDVAQKDCEAANPSVAVIGSEDIFQTTTVRNSPVEGIGLVLAVCSSVIPGTGVFHAITGSICKGKNDKETISLNKDDNEGCVVNKLIESSSQASRSSTIDKLSIHASPFYPRNPLPYNLSLKDMKALNLKAEDLGKDSRMTSSSSKSPVGMLGTRVGDSDSYHILEEEQQLLFGERISEEEVDLVESEQIHEDISFQIVEDFEHKGNGKSKKKRKKKGNKKTK